MFVFSSFRQIADVLSIDDLLRKRHYFEALGPPARNMLCLKTVQHSRQIQKPCLLPGIAFFQGSVLEFLPLLHCFDIRIVENVPDSTAFVSPAK